MKAAYRHIISALAALALLAALGGCAQRDLCYDHSHVSPVAVKFDWSEAPHANPSTMVVWFFPTDGTNGRRFEIIPSKGRASKDFNTTLKVAPGTYRVVTYNGDTDNWERGNTFESFEIYTFDDNVLSPMNRADKAPRPDGSEAQPVRAAPEAIYAHTLGTTVTVAPSSSRAVELTFVPKDALAIWEININNVENLTDAIDVSAIISGAAEAWSPATKGPSGKEVTIPFAMKRSGPASLHGEVMVFGDNAPHDIPHLLRVYTSKMYYYDFDVTDQIHKAYQNPERPVVGPIHIEIEIEGIKLPPSQAEGMTPGVTDWEETEKQEIKM